MAPSIKKSERNKPPRGWTFKEKKSFLEGLKKYGHEDIKMLHLEVPTKTKKAIQKYILYWKTKASGKLLKRYDLQVHLPYDNLNHCPINQWLSAFTYYSDKTQTVLACALELIAHLEEHPDPELSDGVDFKNLYLYLAKSLQGKFTKMADTDCKMFLSNSLVTVSTESKHTRRSEDVEFILNITRLFLDSAKVNSNGNDNTEFPQHLKEIQSQFPYNPLGLQLSSLRKQTKLKY